MRGKKWWMVGLAVVVAAGGAGTYWYMRDEEKPLQAALQTTEVRNGTIAVSISGTGHIEVANRESLTSTASGTIEAVHAKEGDIVKKGDILATFEQAEAEDHSSQIRGKQLDLKKQQLDLDDLKLQYKEAADDEMREQLAIGIQKQQLAIETTQEEIAALQEEDAEDEDALEPIVAPIDGKLVSFALEAGDTVGGQGGAGASELGEIVDYARLQMVVGVDELDIAKVKLGQEAQIDVEALPNETFVGQVTDIAEEGTATGGVAAFDVTIALESSEGLKAGMSAEATIRVEQKENALLLPIEAVQSIGGRYFVLVPSDGSDSAAAGGQAAQGAAEAQGAARPNAQGGQGNPEDRTGAAGGRQSRMMAALAQEGTSVVSVEVGINNEDSIEIVSGLSEGDTVVLPMTATGSESAPMQGGVMIPGVGGLGGAGGFGGAGGGFPGGAGGFQGGGGRAVGGAGR